ncbi:MAG: hypothetical protein U5L95_03215 [Candidatus Saccharibacteria bacterium]|nr:hypothetical protein [Candidatus Saccharibacteria bacterium]
MEEPVDKTAPTTPGDLETDTISSYQINLSWKASKDDQSKVVYEIFRGDSLLARTTTTSFGDSTVRPDTTLYLQSTGCR